MTTISELNHLLFERIRLAASYSDLTMELEKILDSVRYETSKAKALNGFSLTETALPGAIELEPYSRVNVQEHNFSIAHAGENEDGDTLVRKRGEKTETKDDENGSEKRTKLPHGAFRPFGILEPHSAKMARKEAARSLGICCEMAGVRSQICAIDDRLKKIKEDASPDLVEQLKLLSL